MSLRKDVARVVRLRELHSRVERLLTPADRDYFFYALKEYNTYKSVAKLMLALNSCLDTPEKLDLLLCIRELLPRHDRRKFDNLAPYNRMAHPPTAPAPAAATPQPPVSNGRDLGAAGTGGEELKPDVPRGPTQGDVKTVYLQRSKGESLGFNIRGGREHDIGIFISHVDPFSLAERSGLVAGDKIVSVNGFSFDNITHQSAVLILRSHNQLQLSVVSVGFVPGHPAERKSLIWVDASGKSVVEKKEELSTSLEEDRSAGDRLLTSPDKHKIVLMVERDQALGFSVRGGKEFSLGIFISQVDAGSPAERFGLKPGDQIVGVNSHSFISILHHEAVSILKSYTTLFMTVRSLGRLPQLVSEDREEVDGPANPTHHTIPSSPPSQQPQIHSSQVEQSHTHKVNGHTHNTDGHAQPNTIQQKRWSDWRKSVSRRSQSLRDFLRPRSLYAHHPHNPPRSHSHRHQHHQRHSNQDLSPLSRLRTGSDGALRHHSRSHGATQSPLTTSPQKASPPKPRSLSGPSPTPPSVPRKDQPEPRTADSGGNVGEEEKGEIFFRYGVGTQLMLATVSSSAKALLEDSARRCLEPEEMSALTDRLREYENNGGVEAFAEFLVSLLDTPTKMQLLSDVRSVLNPTDLVTFDGIVSPHEISALQKRRSLSPRDRETPNTAAIVMATTPDKRGDGVARKMTSPRTELHRSVGLPPGGSSYPHNGGGKDMSPHLRRVAFEEEEGEGEKEGEGGGEGGGMARERGGDDDDEAATSLREGGGERGDAASTEEDEGEGERGVSVTVHKSAVDEGGASSVNQQLLVEDTLQIDEEREREGGGEREEAWEEGEAEDEGVVEEEEEEEKEELVPVEEEREGEEEEGEREKEELVPVEEEREGEEEEGEREKEETKESTSSQNYDLVLYEIQNHQGQGSLHRAEVREGGMGTPHIGAFGAEPAADLLSRASNEEPSILGMQTRESFLEWNDDYTIDGRERNRDHTPSRNPVIIEIVKSAPQLGLTITGGVDTPSPGVIITHVKEGGAASIDGFLQPGFEIVEVDGVRIRGLVHDSAARELAAAFRSERPTIELIVIPS